MKHNGYLRLSPPLFFDEPTQCLNTAALTTATCHRKLQWLKPTSTTAVVPLQTQLNVTVRAKRFGVARTTILRRLCAAAGVTEFATTPVSL